MTGTVTFAGKEIRVLYGLFLQLLNYFTLAEMEGSLVKGKIEKKKKSKKKRAVVEKSLSGAAATWLMRCVLQHRMHSQPCQSRLRTLSSTTGGFYRAGC